MSSFKAAEANVLSKCTRASSGRFLSSKMRPTNNRNPSPNAQLPSPWIKYWCNSSTAVSSSFDNFPSTSRTRPSKSIAAYLKYHNNDSEWTILRSRNLCCPSFTSRSLNTMAGSRFFRRSFSSSSSFESWRSRFWAGNISGGISLPTASPLAAAAPSGTPSVSDIFSSLSDVDNCFFFFFLSFFFSFLAILSLIAERLRSNAIDCKRACSISLFSSSNPGLSSRAAICGSNAKLFPPSLAERVMAAKMRILNLNYVQKERLKIYVLPISGAKLCPSGVDRISCGKSKMYFGILLPHKNWHNSCENVLQLCFNKS